MINVLKRRAKEQILPVFYYIIGLILYAWVIIAFYPSIQKNINLDEYLKQMPEQFIKFFSGGQTISYSTIEGFLSMEFLSLFFILVIIMFIGAYAGSTIAGSIEKKTLDFQLSQPISRTKLVLADTVVGLAGVFLIVVFTTLAIDLICHGYNISINSRGLLAFAVIAAVFLWAFYGIALLLSSFLKSKMAVTMATLLIVLAFYIFTSLTNIVDRLKDFEKFSLFYIYKTQEILSKGEIHWSHVGILFLIFGLGLVGSLVIFNRRDV